MGWQGLSPAHFLRDYWQQKPLVLRQALPGFQDPLSPEELAGLACEEGVESRLIFTEPGTGSASPAWRMDCGPFEESAFLSLPDKDWTLLVQSVDLWLPALRPLFALVDFLPDWRLDDLLVSYATPGAGAGPHFDYYDVFILQGSGRREWRLGQWCTEDTPLDLRSGLKILDDFHEAERITLETGDLLYIPAGLAHYGCSLDESMSYSIGFRAPAIADIVQGFAAEVAAQLPEHLRYRDPRMTGPGSPHPAEIDDAVAKVLRDAMQEVLNNPAALTDWFGKHMTQARYPELTSAEEDTPLSMAALKALAEKEPLVVNPASRLAFHCSGEEVVLYCDGEAFHLEQSPERLAFIRQLCDRPAGWSVQQLDHAGDTGVGVIRPLSHPEQQALPDDPLLIDLLTALYNRGAISSINDSFF